MVATTLVTADEFARLEDDDVREVIDGDIVLMSPSGKIHMEVVGQIATVLAVDVSTVTGMRLLAGKGGFAIRQNPDTVLVPDLGVMTYDQFRAMMNTGGTCSFQPPLIAIEVQFPTGREAGIARKLSIYTSKRELLRSGGAART